MFTRFDAIEERDRQAGRLTDRHTHEYRTTA